MAWHTTFIVFLLFQRIITALPTEVSNAELALITPAPTLTTGRSPTRVYDRRGLISDLTSEAASYVNSIFSELGSGIPSYVASGILPGFVGLPTGSKVLSSAGVKSTDVDAQPTQVLNIPGYGNWTDFGWNLRIHGFVYKQPIISNKTVDKLANDFLIGTKIQDLPPKESDQAANVTREIYVVQQSNKTVTMNISPNVQDGNTGIGIDQTITLPHITTAEGDFDSFVQLQNVSGSGFLEGNGDIPPQRLDLWAQGTDTGNATSYLVSTTGITIISDIDDILRVTKIYQPKQGILNTFAKPFTPWRNMPDIYRNWSTSLPNLHFHYLTTTPEQITRTYMQFIYDTYPAGSFDDRPLNFSDLSATLSIREYLLVKVFETFPHRKFILVADTSNSDVMRDYPKMATLFPGQVQCIFLRNTSATDPGDRFPYNTDGFKNLNQRRYMFFRTPDDLVGLDIANGECWNSSVPQNLTFGYQGLPFGINLGSGAARGKVSADTALGWALLGVFGVLALGVL